MEFHPFPRLPVELRLKIWELSLHPRDVALIQIQNLPADQKPICKYPPTLLVNRESNYITQPHYSKLYLNCGTDWGRKATRWNSVFNFDNDALKLTWMEAGWLFPSRPDTPELLILSEVEKLKITCIKVAFPGASVGFLFEDPALLNEILKEFTVLESLQLQIQTPVSCSRQQLQKLENKANGLLEKYKEEGERECKARIGPEITIRYV